MLALIKANLLASALGALSAILLAICVYQSVTINGFLWFDGLNDKLENCARDRNELREIAKQKNEQRAETNRNIAKAEQGERKVKPIVEKIRNAPIPLNCATPGIELLRNEI